MGFSHHVFYDTLLCHVYLQYTQSSLTDKRFTKWPTAATKDQVLLVYHQKKINLFQQISYKQKQES